MNRSLKPEVRNPVINLPSFQRLRHLDPPSRALIEDLLADLARDANERAHKSWRQRKGPMAVYWMAVRVYAGHLRRALRSLPDGSEIVL